MGHWLRKKQWIDKRGAVLALFFFGLLLYLAWATSRGDLAIRDTALARIDEKVAVSGTLTNQSGRTFSRLVIEIVFFDADHQRIGEAPAVVQGLTPHSEVRFSTEALPLSRAAHYQVTLPALGSPYGN
jgi:hypothetical protein